MIRVLFVCYGNMCRSPMAEFVMRDLAEKAGLSGSVSADSCGVGDDIAGDMMAVGTVQMLEEHGIPFDPDRLSREYADADYREADCVVAMDMQNVRELMRRTGGDREGKVSLLMSHAGEKRVVDDPWFTHDYRAAYDDIVRGCAGLLAEIAE